MVERQSDIGIRVDVRSETAISTEPARVIVYRNNTPIATIEGRIELEQGADGGFYSVVKLESKAKTTPPQSKHSS